MAISETKMQMVIANYFKDECDVNTSIRQAFEKGFRIGVKKGASTNRPQGEWVRTGRTNIYGDIEVQCSNCNHKVMVQYLDDEWYCRHCGADMGMKGADDE